MTTLSRSTIHIAIVDALEKYVKDNNKGDVPLIFFSGKFDSNQTTFERASNNLEIGVIARNLQTSQVLLRLVHIIIDDKKGFFDVPFEQKKTQTLTLEKYVKYFRERDDYIVSFLTPSIFTSKLMSSSGSFHVESTIDNVDVWTHPRIFSAIRDMI